MVCLWQGTCRVTGMERQGGGAEGGPGAWTSVMRVYTAGGLKPGCLVS